MADRKKAKQAAIDFSVETSTAPAAPAATPTAPVKKSPVTGSELLPGLRKSQREGTVPTHSRAPADAAKRKQEIAAGIDEARMPKQNEAEERYKSDRKVYTDADRQAFAARQEAKRQEALKAYTENPATDAEKKSAKKMQLPKSKFGRGRR